MPAQRSYVGNDQGNGPSIFYYFTEIMVVSFVNLTQNAAGRYWGGGEGSTMTNDLCQLTKWFF